MRMFFVWLFAFTLSGYFVTDFAKLFKRIQKGKSFGWELADTLFSFGLICIFIYLMRGV